MRIFLTTLSLVFVMVLLGSSTRNEVILEGNAVRNDHFRQKKMAITVDDLPLVDYGVSSKDHWNLITRSIINSFKNHKVPAVGFVNEVKLHGNKLSHEERLSVLEIWTTEGLELGNHTYSHPNYHKVGYSKYTEEIIRGEKYSKSLSEKYQLPYRYFRHPYLRSGSSQVERDTLNHFLAKNDYIVAPVTLENTDWHFASEYAKAFKKGDKERMSQVGQLYLQYSEEMLDYQTGLAFNLFDREIAHIMLIHANLINAHYLDELLDLYASKGFKFISLEEALTDEAYASEENTFGDWGIIWTERWALSQGKKGDFFTGYPEPPSW